MNTSGYEGRHKWWLLLVLVSFCCPHPFIPLPIPSFLSPPLHSSPHPFLPLPTPSFLSPSLHSSPHPFIPLPIPLLIAQEWWRIYWGHSYLLPFSGKIYWRESSILFGFLFLMLQTHSVHRIEPSLRMHALNLPYACMHWTFPTHVCIEPSLCMHALNLPYACMHWTFPTHVCIEPSLRMHALNLPYTCMHWTFPSHACIEPSLHIHSFSLVPGAEEGEEKEHLIHTVCACT